MTERVPERDIKEVVIYTDGAAIPNPGVGGYGVVLRFGSHVKELSGGFALTTNNRMELMAVIVGLEALKEHCKVKLHSDSQYIVNAITTESAMRWRKYGWAMNQSGSKLAKNPDLWERLLAAYEKHEVQMIWVKGHVGIEDNERCDQLAMAACQLKGLLPDLGYEVGIDRGHGQKEREHEGPERAAALDQPCRKCGGRIVRRESKRKPPKPGQQYYYSWHLYCTGCQRIYLVEEAKVLLPSSSSKSLIEE